MWAQPQHMWGMRGPAGGASGPHRAPALAGKVLGVTKDVGILGLPVLERSIGVAGAGRTDALTRGKGHCTGTGGVSQQAAGSADGERE